MQFLVTFYCMLSYFGARPTTLDHTIAHGFGMRASGVWGLDDYARPTNADRAHNM